MEIKNVVEHADKGREQYISPSRNFGICNITTTSVRHSNTMAFIW
jgi:hypothetical protein